MPPLTHCALLVRQSKETALNSVQEGQISNNLACYNILGSSSSKDLSYLVISLKILNHSLKKLFF